MTAPGRARTPLADLLSLVWRRLPRLRRFVISSCPPDASSRGALDSLGCHLVEMYPRNLYLAARFRKPQVIKLLSDYLERGVRGWYAMKGPEVVGYGMLAVPQSAPQTVRRFIVHPGEAAPILFYIRPSFRSSGVATALLRELKAVASDDPSVSRLVAWTVPSNAASRRIQAKAGFAPAGGLWIFEFRGRPVFRYVFGSAVKR